jgi:hypothetical protein
MRPRLPQLPRQPQQCATPRISELAPIFASVNDLYKEGDLKWLALDLRDPGGLLDS